MIDERQRVDQKSYKVEILLFSYEVASQIRKIDIHHPLLITSYYFLSLFLASGGEGISL